MFACHLIMVCFICLYMFLSICLYIVSDDEIKMINQSLLLKWDRRYTPTDLVHQRLSILIIDDVHIAKVLSFNECKFCSVPEMFVNYYKIWETGINLRNRSNLDIPWARTDWGLSRCDIKGARLWNIYPQTTGQLIYKKSFHKQVSKFLIRKCN